MKFCHFVSIASIFDLACLACFGFEFCLSAATVNIGLVLQENTATELLQAVIATVEVINNDTSIVSDKTLKLLTYTTSYDQFVPNTQENIVAFVGLFQLSEILFYYPASVASRQNLPILISGASDPRVFSNKGHPHLFHLVQPATETIKQALQFTSAQEWKQLSLITDIFDYQNFDTARQLRQISSQENSQMEVQFYSVSIQEDMEYVLQSLETNILLVAMSAPNIFKLLCKAYLNGTTWPEFVWIVLYVHFEDLLAFSDASIECDPRAIVEGVIFAHQVLSPEETDIILASGLTYEELVSDVYKSTLGSCYNSHRNVLHDSVWATALALNACSCMNRSINDCKLNDILPKLSFSGATGRVDFLPTLNERATTKTVMYQIVNGSKLVFKNCSAEASHFDRIGLNLNIMLEPSSSPGWFILLILCVFLCFIFVSVVLVLYCHYRHKDSIKSTSFSLSLMIFVGCYLILLYQVITNMFFLPQYKSLNKYTSYKVFECFVRIWLHALGVPSILIFATLLVKIARVYYIFLSPPTLKFSSNTALFMYVVVLMIPNTIVLVLWTIDTAQGDGLAKCTGAQHILLWLFLIAAYLLAILLALVILALLTRRIRYKNFKDTKKVNGLVLFLIYTYTFTLFYWMLTWRLNGSETFISKIILNIGHILIVSECVGMLFVPKVYPLVKEAVTTKRSN